MLLSFECFSRSLSISRRVDTISSSPAKRPLAGRGGIYKVKYTGLTPGSATVTLIYARPWDRDAYPIQKVLLNITVK